jgi:hypothetical protein
MKQTKRAVSLLCSGLLLANPIRAFAATHNDANTTYSTTLLEPQTVSKFPDLPIPIGFKLLTDKSYAFETNGTRVAILKYIGKAKTDHLAAFFKEQMSVNNWNLINFIEYGERLLNFDRDQESCIITILPKGNAALITMFLGPKSSRQAKKADKPLK